MKKERNCGYPVYPMYNGQVVTGVNMPMPVPIGMPSYNYTSDSYSSNDLNSLTNRINNLEQRITNLENSLNNYSSNYNSTNYQVM